MRGQLKQLVIITDKSKQSMMLSERKRFNYNVGPTQSLRSSHSQKKFLVTASINPPLSQVNQNENLASSKVVESKVGNKKVDELEAVNRKLIEETTQQFKKLESDVQRVESILQEKDGQIGDLQKESQSLRESNEKMGEEKKILIEAIFEKDMVIREYEAKLRELIESKIHTPSSIPTPQSSQTETQTDPEPESCPKSELTTLIHRNQSLQDELYQAKEELFDARNKVKLLTQQFEAYKLLRQIEDVQ